MRYLFEVKDDDNNIVHTSSSFSVDTLIEMIGAYERNKEKYDDGQGREHDILDEEIENEKE